MNIFIFVTLMPIKRTNQIDSVTDSVICYVPVILITVLAFETRHLVRHLFKYKSLVITVITVCLPSLTLIELTRQCSLIRPIISDKLTLLVSSGSSCHIGGSTCIAGFGDSSLNAVNTVATIECYFSIFCHVINDV